MQEQEFTPRADDTLLLDDDDDEKLFATGAIQQP